jgi:rubrerythrin
MEKLHEREEARVVGTDPDAFQADICPNSGLPYWKCCQCGFLITADRPPVSCPECHEKCAFTNVTCYTPDCGGPGHIDPRL